MVRAVFCRGLIAALALTTACSVLAVPAGAAVPGSGGVVIDGALLPPDRIWDEYRYQHGVKSMIHSKPADVVDERLLERVVQQVVNAELLAREAARRGYALSDAERAALREQEVKRWGTEANYRTACLLLKVGEPFLLARAARNSLVERMVLRESGAERDITEAAVRDWYRENPGRYLPQALPPLRYLFVPAAAESPGLAYQKIAAEADALREARKSFAAVIEAWSRHESAARGGIVPERDAASPPLPFQPPAGKPEECRFTTLQTDPAGLHVYFRDCREPLPFGEVSQRAREELVQDRRARWLKDLGERLRAGARLEYREGPPLPPPAAVTGTKEHGPQGPAH